MRERRISTLCALTAFALLTTPPLRPVAAQADPPPTVVGNSPTPGAVSVSTRSAVRALFSEPVQPGSIVFELRNPSNVLMPATLAYDDAASTAILTPDQELAGNTVFTATVVAASDLAGNPMTAPVTWSFRTATPQFVEKVVFTGLTNPTVLEFSPDGRIFVGEKSGLIKVFSSLTDTTPTVFADLRTNVYNNWDRGMLGLALHPQFPAVPYVYVLYAYDADIGGVAPKWGTPGGTSDPCPTPPGATADGCVVSGRLSRLEASGDVRVGPEVVLIENWFQQYPSHSLGSLAFGADGALYATGGDGASFNFVDYGQDGSPVNPGGDPPVPIGSAQTPPTAEGGALRSQDLRTSADPATLDGALLRVDPLTGAALPDNPLIAHPDANARRIVAYGLRNPFRMTIRPGTNEVYVGDVGWNTWEEINFVANPAGTTVENFGWPCYEGNNHQSGYDSANLNLCENLYNDVGTHAIPLYTYNHSSTVVAGEGCPTGSSSISGLAFYRGSNYPASYDGALFFADYSRDCIWVMFKGANGLPNPANRLTFKPAAANPVDLKLGPDGNIYYVDFTGSIRRFEYVPGNHAPVAVASAVPTNGDAPLSVTFDGGGSSDPDAGDTLTYAWDFNGDAVTDATTATAAHTYTDPGSYSARLMVRDGGGLAGTTLVSITVGSSKPVAVIQSPVAGTTLRVGDTIGFSGSATDREDGTLPDSALSWSLIMQHCSLSGSCHEHPLQDYAGVASGSFVAPDHEYPSHLELRMTATDSSGLQDTHVRILDPQTVVLGFQTAPSGLQLVVGSTTMTTPFSRTVIIGSSNSVSAPSPQTLAAATYQFQNWSSGGAQSHNVTAGAAPVTYLATFVGPPGTPSGLTATTMSSTRITLGWTNAANETGYRVERALNGSGAFLQVASVAANVTTFGNTGLAPGTSYSYRVVAFNASGNSAPSNTATAKTLPSVIRVNFQPASSPVPGGYLVDSGAAFGSRGSGFSYGWNATNNHTRERNSSRSPDQRYDTLNHMQKSGSASWQLAVPNGTYTVRIVSGDAQHIDSTYRINVEGVLAINGKPTTSARWIDRTVTVTVSDGRLTITNATGAVNNKICFVDITTP